MIYFIHYQAVFPPPIFSDAPDPRLRGTGTKWAGEANGIKERI